MPRAIDNEIKLDDNRYTVSRTDSLGVIEYADDYFEEISGYSEAELIGRPHSIVRHPDMPKVVFKIMWEEINKGENIKTIIKNLAKDGSYYWVVADFESKIDPVTNKIVSHTAFERPIPKKAVKSITPIYQKLLEIEKEHNLQASEDYLLVYLEKNNTTYDELVEKLISKKSLFEHLLRL
ncbi:MAG: PAS domain-containing protein [Campylobacterota bacterium]